VTIGAGLRMTGGDPGPVNEDSSRPLGEGPPPMLAGLVGIVVRDPVAANDDGIPDIRVPDLLCTLAAVAGANQDPTRTNADNGRTAMIEHSVGDLLQW